MGPLASLRRWASLGSRERRLVVRAAVLLAAAGPALKVAKVGPVRAGLRLTERLPAAADDADDIALAVVRAGRVVPLGDGCLPQALVAQAMLDAAGHPAKVHLGVAKGGPGGFEAHAWTEVDGRVVVGGPIDRWTRLHTLDDEGGT